MKWRHILLGALLAILFFLLGLAVVLAIAHHRTGGSIEALFL